MREVLEEGRVASSRATAHSQPAVSAFAYERRLGVPTQASNAGWTLVPRPLAIARGTRRRSSEQHETARAQS